jgi:hypothetical protein
MRARSRRRVMMTAPFLLAATEFGREMGGAVCEAHSVEKIEGALLGVLSANHRRDEDVLERGEFGEEEVRLEDESHALVAQAGKSVSGKGIEGGVLE